MTQMRKTQVVFWYLVQVKEGATAPSSPRAEGMAANVTQKMEAEHCTIMTDTGGFAEMVEAPIAMGGIFRRSLSTTTRNRSLLPWARGSN